MDNIARLALCLLLLPAASVLASPQAPSAAPAATPAAAPAPAPAAAHDPNLPPTEATAKSQLDTSPRHGEYVDIALHGGGKLNVWVVYPERKDKAGVVILIHEIYGLSDWLRGVADQLAKEGFIAIAPDLISGMGPNGGGTASVASRDDLVGLIRGLTPDQTRERLDAVFEHARKIPAANGKVATLGFCWGGAHSFGYAASQSALDAAVVFYGVSPEAATLAKIKAPVLGLYGGDDARVNATVGPAEAEMKKLGKTYQPHLFEGAGHGFLRAQDDRDGANLKATKAAWPLALTFLRGRLGK